VFDVILTVGSAYYCKEYLSVVVEMEKPWASFEVLTVVLMKMQVRWNMSPWIFLRLGRMGGTLLCVADVLDWNLNKKIGFLSPLKAVLRWYCKAGHDHFFYTYYTLALKPSYRATMFRL